MTAEKQSIITPERSIFFKHAIIEDYGTYQSLSDGDLWPQAWSDDDNIYTANGDGKGFDLNGEWGDIVVNVVKGDIASGTLSGERISSGEEVSQVWSDPEKYNRKPTGMVSVDGCLYLTVQDLNKEAEGGRIFNDVPAATIVKSTDKGKTWTWDQEKPMFNNHVYTTLMFLDYGKDGENNCFDDYVYAYGLDNNWRASFSKTVPDPTKLYLARIPKDSIQDTSKWEFYTGDLQGNASWSAPGEIELRKPVLQDERRVYVDREKEPSNMSVLSQGSIVYNKPLNRYIYSSWTEFTFEFYESATPWGPWKLFLSKDFGEYPWSENKYGGYATVIPSKFISDDGKEMWVNSQTFVGGYHNYRMSFRKLVVTPNE